MSVENHTEERAGLMDIAARAVSAAKATLSAQAARASSAARATGRRASSDVPDDRDATIARLEQEVGAERDKTSALLETVKQLEFKLEVLERSYSKQLADARERYSAAESEIAELKARLAETQDELAEVTATRDRLSSMLSFDGRRTPPGASAAEAPDDNTINRLLSEDGWADAEAHKRRGALETGGPDHEPPAGDLLAPELVFKADDE